MLAEREVTTVPLTTWRCWRCGRIIARLFLLPGCSVEIKCGKCNALNLAAVDNTVR
jgi:phage FluMu protein Com